MEPQNLMQLFSNMFFRIPDYQRGYAWVEKQLQELWDDIDEIQEFDGEFKNHYTGTIFLEKSKPNNSEEWVSYPFYNVVDGQQRLTTISILLFELLNASPDGYGGKKKSKLIETFLFEENASGNSSVYKFCYLKSDKNYRLLLNKVFENTEILIEDKEFNRYSKNLLFAKEFFATRIKVLTKGELENLFKKVTLNLLFDIRKIEKDLDVQAVFETMNNRGKPLTSLEKLKNRLIYLNDKLPIDNTDKGTLRQDINFAWGRIYNYLAQSPINVLDEDEFLSAHLSLYRKPKESVFSEKLAEEKVFEMFCNKPEKYSLEDAELKEPPISYDKIKTYIKNISDFVPYWYEVNNSNSQLIKKILLLNGSKDIRIFIATLYYKIPDKLTTEGILFKLEQILFRNRVPGIYVMDERKPSTWARSIYNSGEELNEKIIEVIKELDEDLGAEIINLNVINGFHSLFTYVRGPVGFHRWNLLKYFLFEYDIELQNLYGEDNRKISLDDFYETTIEHIIPQKYETHWLNQVKILTDRYEDIDTKQLLSKVLLNSLGNLTILKNGKNASLGNREWTLKKHRFGTGSYNEINISFNSNWEKLEITDRGIALLKFLQKKVPALIMSEEEMYECLYFDKNISEAIKIEI